ncbi:MAG: DUF1015 family protein [Thermoplasmata archaeon]
MVQLNPVRSWHPDPATVDPNQLVCPVYDTLSQADFQRFGGTPLNAAQFVPRPKEVPVDRFVQSAVQRLGAAIKSGAYRRDATDSYYVYGIRYIPPPDILETIDAEDQRSEYLLLGLVGALDFDRLQHGQVAMHERTFADRVDERVALTDATGMSFAPIMAGYHSADHHLNDLLEGELGLDRRRLAFDGPMAPTVEATLDGTTHRLWRIDDPARVALIEEEIRKLRILILDGHHRFTAFAKRHYAGRRSAPLTMLVEGRDRALQLLPWHRVLRASIRSFETIFAAARREFSSIEDHTESPTVDRVLERLRAMTREHLRGFLIVSQNRMLEVKEPPSDDVGTDFDRLHEFLEETLQLDPESMEFVRSPRRAMEAISASRATLGTAFLLPGMTEEGIEHRAFDRGSVMAQKSTMFLPKVAEGMLFAPANGVD